MSRSIRARNIAFLFFILFCTSYVPTQAQTSVFTYQGRLVDATVPQPTNGNYEMQFSLWDTEQVGTGNQLDVTKTLSSVAVTGGVFAVKLDFEPYWFGASNCFIEVSVRPAFTFGTFTTLGPRQQITAAPLASRSLSSARADTAYTAEFLDGIPASGFVRSTDPRLSDNRNPTAFSTNYIQNQGANPQSASLNISGGATIGGTTNVATLNGVTLNGATLSLSGNATAVGTVSGNTVNSNTQFNINGARVFATDGSNNTFAGQFSASGGSSNTMIGYNTGNPALTVIGTTAVGTNAHPQGNLVTLVGYQTGSGVGVVNSTAIGANAFVATSNTIKIGTLSESTEFPGLVRVNTLGQAGSTALCRNGSLQISTCTASRGEENEEMVRLLREQNMQMLEQLRLQQRDIEALRVVVCSLDRAAAICLKKGIE